MITTILFLVVLAVLIFVHELGHFLAAKLFGIRVDAFKIGFGPKIFAWKRGETEYGLNLIPFGGYVKIYGENPDEENLNASGSDASRSFVLKPRWQQIIVLGAGVTCNFIFAWLIYVIVFTTGVTAPSTDGFVGYEQYFHDSSVMISEITPKSPAEAAGLAVGDFLVHIKVASSTATSSEWVASQPIDGISKVINGSKGAAVIVEYRHGSNVEILKASVTPAQNVISKTPNSYAIGMAMDQTVTVKLPVWISLWEGAHYTYLRMTDMLSQIFTMISNAVVGQGHLSDVKGPVGIAVIVKDNASLGFNYLLMTVAFISINLGIVNLIPFPALDGGRIAFVILEGILRRRIDPKFFNIVNFVGFSLLMLLIVVVTWSDIAALIFPAK